MKFKGSLRLHWRIGKTIRKVKIQLDEPRDYRILCGLNVGRYYRTSRMEQRDVLTLPPLLIKWHRTDGESLENIVMGFFNWLSGTNKDKERPKRRCKHPILWRGLGVEMTLMAEESIDVFRSMPTYLSSTEEQLDQAEMYFEEVNYDK